MAQNVLDPNKYHRMTSIDGTMLKKGYVLAPIWIQDGYEIPDENKQHLTTIHIAGFKFRIGFMQIPIEKFKGEMESFWEEIRKYLSEYCEGRCIIGHKTNGEPICCPKSKKCTGCPERYEHEHYNSLKDLYIILSLDYCFENEDFDYADQNAVNPEEYVCAQEEPSQDELYESLIAYFEKKNPRYATIIRMSMQKKLVEDIFKAIGLSHSRGYEEIENTFNAVCEFLNLSCYKTKKLKKK